MCLELSEDETVMSGGSDFTSGQSEQATLSINGLWTILSQLGVQLTPIEREEVKACRVRAGVCGGILSVL